MNDILTSVSHHISPAWCLPPEMSRIFFHNHVLHLTGGVFLLGAPTHSTVVLRSHFHFEYQIFYQISFFSPDRNHQSYHPLAPSLLSAAWTPAPIEEQSRICVQDIVAALRFCTFLPHHVYLMGLVCHTRLSNSSNSTDIDWCVL